MGFTDNLSHAWDMFRNRDPTQEYRYDLGPSYTYRPDRVRLAQGKERSIVSAIYNRIALDAACIDIKHIRLDENGRYLEDLPSGLNNCLNVEANTDQSGRAFKIDLYASLLDEGVIAIVPVETNINPKNAGSFDIETMRIGKVIQWYPEHVRVRLYNEQLGHKDEITLPKSMVGIVENPFFAVFNEPNSTNQRLIRKLAMLDSVDEQASSGKLDMIIQLPYVIRSEERRKQAELRRAEIERQLTGSKYGIAYTDGTEKITQLNRSLDNNLMAQVEYLTSTLYSQLGLTPEIMNGTADEKTMLNYMNRTIEPLVSAVVMEMRRKFLSKTARTRGQTIDFFRDPFKLVPVNNLADIADKFTRNEIMTSNEFRQIVGMKPSDDPNADTLRNKNMRVEDTGAVPAIESGNEETRSKEEGQNE